MEFLDLSPMLGAVGTVRLPGSKSISNRVLLLAALAEGSTEIRDLLASDDVERMLEALQALGVRWTRKGESLDYVVEGAGGPFPVKTAELFLGNAGTAFRPLTAALALSGNIPTVPVTLAHELKINPFLRTGEPDVVDRTAQLSGSKPANGEAVFTALRELKNQF